MEKLLSQTEIDALFRVARDGSVAYQGAREALIEPWDLHQAGMLGKEQLHGVSQLHESFARNLTGAVGDYLREKFEVALVAVEQLAYRDLLARSTEVAYYSTIRLTPGEARGILHLDLGLLFSIVDLLLGGSGAMNGPTRQVTEIEESIFHSVGQVICNELRVVTQVLGMDAEFERGQPAAQLLRIMPPEEKTLALTFEVTMSRSKGMLNIVFPSIISSVLIRKLRADLVYAHARGPAVSQECIGERLLKSVVTMELGTPVVSVRLGQMLNLQRGYLLPLPLSIKEPAMLRLRGRECWSARPANSQNRRAAQLLQPLVREPGGRS